jgi:hypothetical protein
MRFQRHRVDLEVSAASHSAVRFRDRLAHVFPDMIGREGDKAYAI